MSLETIIAAYKSTLEGVAGIAGVANVYDYQREATSEAVFKSLFLDADKTRVHFWDIHREAKPAEAEHLSRVSDAQHAILIRGFMALKDDEATGKTFRQLIEAIFAAFRPLKTLNGAALNSAPMILTTETQGMFGSVLCHYAELRQTVWERVTF